MPEGHAHFFQQLGYVLATLLLFILLLITVILVTRQRCRADTTPGEARPKWQQPRLEPPPTGDADWKSTSWQG